MDDIQAIPGQIDITKRLINVIKNLPPERQSELLDSLNKEKSGKAVDNEQRLNSRKDIFLPVDFASSDKFFRDFIRDISLGGVFIETKQPLKTGQKLAMTFMTPDNQHHVKINGIIVRDIQNGIGVKFDNTTPEKAAQIKEFLSRI